MLAIQVSKVAIKTAKTKFLNLMSKSSVNVTEPLPLANLSNEALTNIKPQYFDGEELKQVIRKSKEYYNNTILKQINPTKKPKICYINHKGSFAFVHPLTGDIMINNYILTSPDFYKLVDIKTGKCIESSIKHFQCTGSKKELEYYIRKCNFKSAQIIPLTKEERLKVLYSTFAHETFHIEQLCNMMRHPNIGKEKFFNSLIDGVSLNKFKYHILKLFYNMSWKSVCKLSKLDLNSELGKKTMEQYKKWINLKNKFSYNKYKHSPMEKEAYRREREFAIKNDLLL